MWERVCGARGVVRLRVFRGIVSYVCYYVLFFIRCFVYMFVVIR